MKTYLVTWNEYGHGGPCNHGLTMIDSRGYVHGATPIEDYGWWITQDHPFTASPNALARMFIDLMED